MKTIEDESRMVRCSYGGAVTYIPVRLFHEMTDRVSYFGKKYVRYKEGAEMYSMSESKFYKLAHDAKAIYKLDKVALVKIDIIDDYLEYFRE